MQNAKVKMGRSEMEIQITVKLFAVLKETVGKRELNLAFPERVSATDVLSYLRGEFESLTPVLNRSLVAINGAYADPDAFLSSGDEIAILPPVSGG